VFLLSSRIIRVSQLQMSLVGKPKMIGYEDRNSFIDQGSSPNCHNCSQKSDDSSNSSLDYSEQYFSGGISTRYYKGVVKSFNSREGYGFIACTELMQEYGCDVFMHKKQFFAATVSLRIGDSVRFRLEFSKQGKPQARELSRIAEAPVAVLRRLGTRSPKPEVEQVSILRPDPLSQKRKRKVSFKEEVEVCEAGEVKVEEAKADSEIVPMIPMKEKLINVAPVKKFTSLLTQKEAKENSSLCKIFSGEEKTGTCTVETKKSPLKQVTVAPNRTTDPGAKDDQTLDMSPVSSTINSKMQTRKLVSPRLEERVISTDESPQASDLPAQGEKKEDETVQPRLEEGVINVVLPKNDAKETTSIISKKDAKKATNRKRVTFKLAKEIIDDSDSGWSSGRSLRQIKKRQGMMKNFGATVRRKVKNYSESETSKGCGAARSEGELEEDREKELARLASETFEKLQRVQKESKIKKVPLKPQPKITEKNSDSKTDPAYLDWSLGFGEGESTSPSEPKTKREQGDSPCTNSNVEGQVDFKTEEGEKKLDSKSLRTREEWFRKPPVCRKPKVPPSETNKESNKESNKWLRNPSRRVDWGPRVVLTEVQGRERGSSRPTRGGFHGLHEGYSSRRREQERCGDAFETYREERHCTRELGGQILNRQQSQPIQSRREGEKKAVGNQSMWLNNGQWAMFSAGEAIRTRTSASKVQVSSTVRWA